MSKNYAILGGLIVVAAFFVFRTPVEAEQGTSVPKKTYHSAPNPWSNDEVLAARSEGNWRGSVRLDRGPGGHYYSYAHIGDAKIKVVVDTGATMVALTGDDARKAGLSWDASEVKVVGRGASGDVHGVERRIRRLDVGGIVATDVDAVIVPSGLDITLLGQSYLSHVRRVEINGGKMLLSNM